MGSFSVMTHRVVCRLQLILSECSWLDDLTRECSKALESQHLTNVVLVFCIQTYWEKKKKRKGRRVFKEQLAE